jgi:hypothetical protein
MSGSMIPFYGNAPFCSPACGSLGLKSNVWHLLHVANHCANPLPAPRKPLVAGLKAGADSLKRAADSKKILTVIYEYRYKPDSVNVTGAMLAREIAW